MTARGVHYKRTPLFYSPSVKKCLRSRKSSDCVRLVMTAPKNFIAVAAERATGIHFVSEQVGDSLEEPKPFNFIVTDPPRPRTPAQHRSIERVAARKKRPGACHGCGRDNDREGKTTCTRCADKNAQRYDSRKLSKLLGRALSQKEKEILAKAAKPQKAARLIEIVLARIYAIEKRTQGFQVIPALIRRIESLENTVARLDMSIRRDYQRAYMRGWHRGTKQRPGAWEPRSVTKQEAATMSHAYVKKR